MKSAYVCVPAIEDHYPRSSLLVGLQRLGFVATPEWQKADILVTWSPWLGSHRHTIAEYFRHSSRPVIVVENGWLSPIRNRNFYQLAFDGWNGTGRYCAGGPERWASWGVELKPWYAHPLGFSLVIGQRGHPTDRRTAAPGWHRELKLQALGIRIRDKDSAVPLDCDIASAREVHVWTSNVASAAVIAGVPVIQHGPNLAVSELASRDPEHYAMPERLPVLQRLAWNQWTALELASGEAFAWLLGEAMA